jgi:hypothetical protein
VFLSETYRSPAPELLTGGFGATAVPAISFSMEQRQRIDLRWGIATETVIETLATLPRPSGALVQTSRESVVIALR